MIKVTSLQQIEAINLVDKLVEDYGIEAGKIAQEIWNLGTQHGFNEFATKLKQGVTND
jgi:hypothetical protein